MSVRHRYFAYGSNLHRAQMASLAPSARPQGVARLAGWELFVNDHGVLSIRPAGPDDEVLGLVWTCSGHELAQLDRFEAVPEGLYVRGQVLVTPPDDGPGSRSGAGCGLGLAPDRDVGADAGAGNKAGAGNEAGNEAEAAGPCFVYWSVSTATGRPRPGYLEHSVLPPMRALGLPPPYLARVEAWLAAGTAGPRWIPVPGPGTVFNVFNAADRAGPAAEGRTL